MTADLAAWLTRIWDEQEAAAKACEEVYPSPWEVSDRGWMAKVQADQPGFRIVAELEQHPSIDGWLSTRLDHLALHDPASVLARIAADRQILADYRKVLRQQEENSDEFALLMRQPVEDYGRLNQVKTFGWQVQGRVEALSAVVRLLASPHADRPGYQSEWRP